MRFNRRHLLWTGLGIGVTVACTKEHLRTQAVRKQQELNTLAQESLSDHLSIMERAYVSDADWEKEIEKRKKLLLSNNLTPPTQPYNREISKRLIQLCKLAVQQYKTGRANPNYDGSINLLPAYHNQLNAYTQLINFKIEEEIIEDYFNKKNSPIPQDKIDDSNPLEETFQEVELTLQDKVQQILQGKHRLPVYFGTVLTSQESNILVFRGTQTQADWLRNLNATQQEYVAPSGEVYGEVHAGFLKLMRQKIKPSLSEIVKQLDPTIPCYITGHSLGAAIATLAAMEIVQIAPQFQDKIQLYAYAGPRVGSQTFAKIHSQLIPNSYRIVNLGDSVPLVPPITLGNSYTHLGQEWSFLAQFGDVLLNHIVDTYQAALEQEAETEQVRTYVKQLYLPRS